ncbi:DUF2795 domain-containing protein [Streptomyces sp. 4N509B]|uniref:DUF2795 domain-containing protein n=1 Tax=Streptomyces sp. 4N509B TaxID=3457413 RepID=UPI003FD637FC
MQQRGSDRVSPQRDDAMKRELDDRLRAERPLRAEEWRDPEPTAEDDPEVARRTVPPRGDPDVDEAEDVEFRFELARHLRPTIFPAKRQEVLSTLQAEHAPDALVEAARELPKGVTYVNVQEVADALGRGPSR